MYKGERGAAWVHFQAMVMLEVMGCICNKLHICEALL